MRRTDYADRTAGPTPGKLYADLTVACDGRTSILRQAAGLTATEYPVPLPTNNCAPRASRPYARVWASSSPRSPPTPGLSITDSETFPLVDGAPEGIRTPNLLIRSQMLYPLSYGRRSSVVSWLTSQPRRRREDLNLRSPLRGTTH